MPAFIQYAQAYNIHNVYAYIKIITFTHGYTCMNTYMYTHAYNHTYIYVSV